MGKQLSFKLNDTAKTLPPIGKELGSGSSRIVYSSKRGTVVKIAKNLAGVAQNESEVEISKMSTDQTPIARVLDHAKDYSWVVAQRASQASRVSLVDMGELQKAMPVPVGDIYSINVGKINGKPVVVDYGFYGETVLSLYREGTFSSMTCFSDLKSRVDLFPKHKSFSE